MLTYAAVQRSFDDNGDQVVVPEALRPYRSSLAGAAGTQFTTQLQLVARWSISRYSVYHSVAELVAASWMEQLQVLSLLAFLVHQSNTDTPEYLLPYCASIKDLLRLYEGD